MSTTVLEIEPIFGKNYAVICAALDYRKHIDSFALVPQTQTQTWRGAGNNTHSDVSVIGWNVQAGYMQDWKSEDSFSRFLQEHAGETLTFTFEPQAGEGTSWTVDVVIVPGQVGGAIGSPLNVTVTLACATDPVPTYPA